MDGSHNYRRDAGERFQSSSFFKTLVNNLRWVFSSNFLTGGLHFHMIRDISILIQTGIFVDLGIYGWSPLQNWAGKDPTLRMFEKFTLKHGGYQVEQSILNSSLLFYAAGLIAFQSNSTFKVIFPGAVCGHSHVI